MHDSFDVPGVDLLTFTLDNAKSFDPTRPIYIDAETPDLALNASQTRILIRRLIGGLKAAGLQQGECVLVALSNNVSTTVADEDTRSDTRSSFILQSFSASSELAVFTMGQTPTVSRLS